MALVYSFYGYVDEISNLNRQLSNASRGYYREHRQELRAFCTKWLPDAKTKIEFGSANYSLTSDYQDWNRKYYAWGKKKDPTPE